ncbi:maleylpyruvate isomerase N-terminal domain-containing protein [Frankia sp. CiP3]|uniref:maleylpyruvate isomerase N-terminal domain-containing protein n=1 Tax=Frankia sp. CiP3 TaxID=2880971 RepID=UPI001EF58404|nr:maleylpyruvate isomerase N-terminal domain-containing protein [Frankia sp. CiP3]
MEAGDGHVTDLLGAWALDACDTEEADAVAAHVRGCPSCAREAATLRQAAAALTMLTVRADADAWLPPPVARVLTAALARRRPASPVPAFAAPFAAAAGLLESALAEIDETAWGTPSPVRGWTISDLVAHLAATDGLLAAAIGIAADPPVDPHQNTVAHSELVIAHARTRPPAHSRELWRHGVQAIAARLRAEPALASRIVQVGGIEMAVADHLVTRAFETWIHARDIAQVTGLRLPNPLGEHLHAMSGLAARLLDQLCASHALGLGTPTSGGSPAGVVRLTLTGPGGGSWLVRVGAAGHAEAADDAARTPPTAEVSLHTVEFCLLVGDRRTPGDLDVVITGDDALGRRLLALAPALSGP